MRGRGVSAANRSSNSIGSNSRCVVPSLHSAFKVRSTRPSAVHVSRSCAIGGRSFSEVAGQLEPQGKDPEP